MDNTRNVDITDQILDRFELPSGVERVHLHDTTLRGFGVIIGKTRYSFVVRKYVKGRKGKRPLVTLGHWAPSKLRAADPHLRAATLTVRMARDAASAAIGGMRAGTDPSAPAGGPTFGSALALHVDLMRRKEASPLSIATLTDEVKRHIGDWTERPLREITRTECRELHQSLSDERGTYVANRLMRHVRAIYNTSLKEHELPANPTIAVHWNKEERRQEPIPWANLPAWRAAIDKLSAVRRDYNLVALLTGLRRMDAATIRWEHVDFKARTLRRPNPKGGADRAFTIPLSRACVEILTRRKRENLDDHGWAFPGVAGKSKECYLCTALGLGPHIAGVVIHVSDGREPYPKKTGKAPRILPSAHRLRDTYTSALAALKDPPLSPFVIDVLTNHRPPKGSVTAGYIQIDTDSLAEAQERLTAFLLGKIDPTAKPARAPRRRKGA
jgi:integrase